MLMQNIVLQRLKQKFISTYIEDEVDQVVAMIMRTTNSQQIQLLYLQRAYSEKDYYSGDLCFPGGHRESGESCYQTALRQVQQQTGLVLNEANFLGTLNYKLRTTIGKSKVIGKSNEKIQLFMGVLMFQIQYDPNLEIKLQLNQVRSFKWVNIRTTFFFAKKQNFTRWSPAIVYLPERKYKTYFPAYQIGMERCLWGLTFNITMLFVSALYQIAIQNSDFVIQRDENIFKQMMEFIADLQIQGEAETVKLIKNHYFEGRIWTIKPKL